MKIAYTTETYLIKEITSQTPATKAVKPNDLVQFVAYKDRNDYGGNFTQLYRLVVNGKKTKHILTETKMIDFLNYYTESINMNSIDLETFEAKDKIEVPLKDEFVKVETFAKKLKWNKSDLKTLLELTTDETIIDFNYDRSEKETIKKTLQNYVLTKLQKGVNDISLFFIFELDDEFGNFACFDFVKTLNEKDLELINKELKSYFVELLEFEPDSYTLNTVVEAMNDPADYGELIKVTATISIKKD